MSHLATTYAAVHALALIGTKDAYETINRNTLNQFLLSLKQPDGSFRMHVGGEIDVRGSFCAFTVASLLKINSEELLYRAGEFISKCQTYEGGIGGFPGVEAHGGYTFCAVAALTIIDCMHVIDIPNLSVLKICNGSFGWLIAKCRWKGDSLAEPTNW